MRCNWGTALFKSWIQASSNQLTELYNNQTKVWWTSNANMHLRTTFGSRFLQDSVVKRDNGWAEHKSRRKPISKTFFERVKVLSDCLYFTEPLCLMRPEHQLLLCLKSCCWHLNSALMEFLTAVRRGIWTNTHTHTYKSLDHTPKHTEELSGRASSLFLSTFNVGVSELLFKAKISQYELLF